MILRMLRRFARLKGGNVATFSAMAALPIAVGVGMAVDMGDSYRRKERLQTATDAAALSAARVLMEQGGKAAAEDAARKYPVSYTHLRRRRCL